MTVPDLRPLGIGEILDRAVTLFVRRCAVLVLILALVAIPIAIAQYVAQPQMTALFDDLQRVLAVPASSPHDQSQAIGRALARSRIGPAGFAILAAALVLGVVASTACVIAVAQSYAGAMPSVREVYRIALRRWIPQLVGQLFYVVLAVVVMIVVFVVFFLVTLAIAVLAGKSVILATIAGIPAGIVGLLGIFGGVALFYFAAQMTLISIALEDANPIRGIAQGLRRTFGRPLLRRSLLVATVVFIVSGVGQLVLVALGGTLAVLTHLSALYPIVAVIGGIGLNALVTTFLVVYTFDVRVRREGFDLVLAAQSPAFSRSES